MNTSAKPGRNFITVSMFGEGQSFLAQLVINQRLFLDKNLCVMCVQTLFSTSSHRTGELLRP